MKTLKGYDETQVIELMLTPLPQKAIKSHQTKGYLSHISPAYTRERLTKIFGLHGVGWGLDWDPLITDRFETKTSAGKPRHHFALMQANFWFKMLDGDKEVTVNIPVTGYSDNDNIGDAMAGARTSAISAGAKELLFQLHVYKDEPAPTPKPKELKATKKPANGNGNSSGEVEELFIASEDDLLVIVNRATGGYFKNVFHIRNAIKKINYDLDYPPAPNAHSEWDIFKDALIEYATAPNTA